MYSRSQVPLGLKIYMLTLLYWMLCPVVCRGDSPQREAACEVDVAQSGGKRASRGSRVLASRVGGGPRASVSGLEGAASTLWLVESKISPASGRRQ